MKKNKQKNEKTNEIDSGKKTPNDSKILEKQIRKSFRQLIVFGFQISTFNVLSVYKLINGKNNKKNYKQKKQ